MRKKIAMTQSSYDMTPPLEPVLVEAEKPLGPEMQ